jgi:hypothetical protein
MTGFGGKTYCHLKAVMHTSSEISASFRHRTGCKRPCQCAVHSFRLAKESSSAIALYSTSTGIFASCHGVSHKDRALLALMFEERFEGELPPREANYKASLAALLTDEEVW